MLLNFGDESAEESTKVLASVSRGNRDGSDSRECNAASLAEVRAAETIGDGKLVKVSSETSREDELCVSIVSFDRGAAAVACDRDRIVKGERCCRDFALLCSNVPLHRGTRSLFI